jgi:HEAT repeat protein
MARAHPIAAILVAALLGTSCGKPSEPADAYSVTLDVGPWIEALGSDDLFESEPALDRLVALGPAAIAPLEAALEREGPAVRAGAVNTLGQIALPECVPPLIRAARDPDQEVRAEALTTLGRLGDERAREAVESALHDPAPVVVQAAAAACGVLCRSPAALRRLVEVALSSETTAGALAARNGIRVILAGSDTDQNAALREVLIELAVPLLQADAPAMQRARAALLAADAGDSRAIPWLVEAVKMEEAPLLRLQAVLTLGSMADPAAVNALLQVTRAESGALAAAACQALGQLAKREVRGASRAFETCREPAREERPKGAPR